MIQKQGIAKIAPNIGSTMELSGKLRFMTQDQLDVDTTESNRSQAVYSNSH
jgi:hypothetical protein